MANKFHSFLGSVVYAIYIMMGFGEADISFPLHYKTPLLSSLLLSLYLLGNARNFWTK